MGEQLKYFEDIQIGEKYETGGRTITESDIMTFAGLTSDYNRLHIDEEYMKDSIFGTRIAHGVLVLAMQSGMTTTIVHPRIAILAFLGISDWKFKKPVFIGDTIHVEIEVEDKRETSKEDRGILVWNRKVLNQNDEIVQEGKHLIMVYRKQIEKS
ncbi:MaoC/PaaZ C-terminal domain-containing protein [Pseudalkalibacillus sp. A8]|uniref:MaoC/PaaZ C-terminal domain-containing protein n=1 Tax=Pseudalkalibacillus sp. A8 TaxID=3382641 RepID=UPI0038B4F244